MRVKPPKTRTKILRIAAGTSLLFILFFAFNGLVKWGAQAALGAAVGTKVAVGRMDIRWLDSEIEIRDIRVYNPPDFTAPYFALIPEFFVRYDLSALLRRTFHLKLVRFSLEQVYLERNKEGKFNLTSLGALEKTQKKAPAGKPSPAGTREAAAQKPAGEAPVKIQIDKVDFSIGGATFIDHSLLGNGVMRQLQINIRNAVLTDITDPARITQQIVIILSKKAGISALSHEIGHFKQKAQAQGQQLVAQASGFINRMKQKRQN